MKFTLINIGIALLSFAATEVKPSPNPIEQLALKDQPRPITPVYQQEPEPTLPSYLYFGLDSASLAPSELAKLAQVVAFLDSNRSYDVFLMGYADALGNSGYNQGLGMRRAQSVASFISHSFPNSRLKITLGSNGEVAADGRSGREFRKVEVKLLPK